MSWLNYFSILIYSFFSFKQVPNLLGLSPYQTPIIQMMIRYISSFVNHLKKAVLRIRQFFLELEEFVRQDIFILLKHVCMCLNNYPCNGELKVSVHYLYLVRYIHTILHAWFFRSERKRKKSDSAFQCYSFLFQCLSYCPSVSLFGTSLLSLMLYPFANDWYSSKITACPNLWRLKCSYTLNNLI